MPVASVDIWLQNPVYRALLDDVIENPDDDTPRLVMADWLEEHGDEVAQDRAQFIRLQVQRAQRHPYAPETWVMRRQEARLLRQHRHAWLGRLERFVSKATFHRGFPEELVLGVAQFVKNATHLFRLTPVRQLQLLRIAQTKLTVGELAAIPGFGQLRGLSLRHSNLGDARIEELLYRLPLCRLESLDLAGCNLGPLSCERLAKAALPRLHTLSLASNHIVNCAQRVIQAVGTRPLQSLNLACTALDARAIQQLAEWPGLTSLKHLDLSGIPMGARAATQLFESPLLGELDSLTLGNCAIRQGGAAALARSRALQNLRKLNLISDELASGGLENLTSGPYLQRLEHLDLSNNFLNHHQAIASLGRWPGLRSLRSLRLDYNALENAGLEKLLASEHLGALTSLSLVGTQLRPGVGAVLGRSPRLAQLAHLNLTYNSLRSEDVSVLVESPHLGQLCELLVPPLRFPANLQARLDSLRPS